MASSPPSVIKSLREMAYTAWLFNESDFISTLGPAIVVALVLVGVPDLKSFLQGLIFHQLHLIAFQISNQIVGLEEDKMSKPHRPLVSGRVTVETAHNIYLALVILSLWNSAEHGVLACSVLHTVAMIVYNEGNLVKYWMFKSFLGSCGYMSYCWGVTVIYGHGRPLSQASIIAIISSGLIFTTTGHAQDFRDRDADAAIGRKTLAIVLPQTFARWSLTLLIFAWTAGLIHFWGPPPAFSLLFCGLAALTTIKFVSNYSIEADRSSYWWYNIWLIAAHIIPLFNRFPQPAHYFRFSL